MRWLTASISVMVPAAIVWHGVPLESWLQNAKAAWVDLGAMGLVLFVMVCALAVVAFAPASPITIAAGTVYGLWGLPVALVGAMLGATVTFIAARGLLRDAPVS